MIDSEYIVYVDESGDPSLTSINPQYPIFVVAFCIVHKARYSIAVNDLLALKFSTFGHDQTVLHEREIRKRLGDFSFLNDSAQRQRFLNEVSVFVQRAPFTLIAAIIQKAVLLAQNPQPENPYDLALKFCLEETFDFLKSVNQESRRAHIICESRGTKEDKDLEIAFLRTSSGANRWNCTLPFSIRFSHKQCNSTGMQLADLVARPVGQEFLKPGSQARIYPVISAKFRDAGRPESRGRIVFP
jgi:hypothetical protein